MNRYIEFVEEEIEFCQLKINKAKEEKIYRETIALIVPENKNINSVAVNEIEISLNEYKIKCLQQIKCELEAWEELNKTFEIGVEKQIEEIYIKGKNYYGNEKTIWGYSKEGALKVKKALDVGDE